MIDIDTSCRICLEDRAIYDIFKNEQYEDILSKIATSLDVKLEDIDGYPRKICTKCKDTIEMICDFKTKYLETCEILKRKIPKVEVKSEEDESYSDNDYDMDNIISCVTPKLEVDIDIEQNSHKNILKSLTEITVKKLSNDNVKNINVGSKYNITRPVEPKNVKPNSVKKIAKKIKSDKLSKDQKKNNEITQETADVIIKTDSEKEEKQEIKEERIILSKSNLAKESKEKAPPTPRLCDQCGQTFDKYSELMEHKRTHRPERYKCDKCSKSYLAKHSLITHVLKYHEKVKNTTCDQCGNAFFGVKELLAHVRYVHEKKRSNPTIFKCKFCSKTYTHKRGIVCHERSVHTGERPAVCSICKSAFYDVVYLREHMRLHTGDAPFKCPICNRGYAQSGNMKSHLRNHRLSELDADVISKLRPTYLKYLRP